MDNEQRQEDLRKRYEEMTGRPVSSEEWEQKGEEAYNRHKDLLKDCIDMMSEMEAEGHKFPTPMYKVRNQYGLSDT